MSKTKNSMVVIGADVSQGNLLVHFSDGESVLFQAHFLSDEREADGNRAVPESSEEEQDELTVV